MLVTKLKETDNEWTQCSMNWLREDGYYIDKDDNWSCHAPSEVPACSGGEFWIRDLWSQDGGSCYTAQEGCEAMKDAGPGFEWDAEMGQ